MSSYRSTVFRFWAPWALLLVQCGGSRVPATQSVTLAGPSTSATRSAAPPPSAKAPTLELVGQLLGTSERQVRSHSPTLDRTGSLVLVDAANELRPGNYLSTIRVAALFDRNREQAELVSRTPSGRAADLSSGADAPILASDGCCVVWRSAAADIVAGDSNGKADVFLTRRDTGAVERISVSTDGGDADGESFDPFVTTGGERVFFFSDATNLVAGDTNRRRDLFVRDVASKTTRKVELSNDGRDVDRGLNSISFAADGSVAAFGTQDEQLQGLPRSTAPIAEQVMVRVFAEGKTDCLICGGPGSTAPYLTRNGRYLVFLSDLKVAPAEPDFGGKIYVHDRETGKLERVYAVELGNALGSPVISDDGRIVAFMLTPPDPDAGRERGYGEPIPQVIQHVVALNRDTGKVTDLSLALQGDAPNGPSFSPSISADGDVVAFYSEASNLVPGQQQPKAGDASPPHTFVYDGVRRAGALQRIPVTPGK